LNDVIHPVMNCEVTNYSFRIFDRYGKLVFEGKQPQDAWNGHTNGKPMDIGVYFWVLQFKDQLGTEHLHKGDMTLLR
jgi:gliding motility-associated-like protein